VNVPDFRKPALRLSRGFDKNCLGAVKDSRLVLLEVNNEGVRAETRACDMQRYCPWGAAE
jgi:hypothetical protein